MKLVFLNFSSYKHAGIDGFKVLYFNAEFYNCFQSGIWSSMLNGSTSDYFVPLLQTSRLHVLLYQLTSSMSMSAPGPGSWLLMASSTCIVRYEVCAAGVPDFTYTFYAGLNSSFIPLTIPILGTALISKIFAMRYQLFIFYKRFHIPTNLINFSYRCPRIRRHFSVESMAAVLCSPAVALY